MNPATELMIELLEPGRIDRKLAWQSERRKEVERNADRRAAFGAQQTWLLHRLARTAFNHWNSDLA
jgi:hypothetical protein